MPINKKTIPLKPYPSNAISFFFFFIFFTFYIGLFIFHMYKKPYSLYNKLVVL